MDHKSKMICIFTDEYDYMIHLAACAVRGISPAELPDGLSFVGVYRRAVEHDIAGLTFYSVEKLAVKPDAGLFRRWRDRRGLSTVRDIRQSYAADKLRNALDLCGIRFCEMQGTRLKGLYPTPDMRTMSDIDIVVDPSELSRAGGVLRDLGYETKIEEGGMTITGSIGVDINAEIHGAFFASDEDYQSALEKSGLDGDALLYVYTILHTEKHFRSGGCGVRRILDLYLLNKKYVGFSALPEVIAALENAGASALSGTLFRLAEYWFGDGKYDCDFRDTEEYIKRSGLHGSFEHSALNRYSYSKKGRIRYMLRRAFPSLRDLSSAYPSLLRHRALYPAFAVHRLIKRRREASAEIRVLRKEKSRDGVKNAVQRTDKKL